MDNYWDYDDIAENDFDKKYPNLSRLKRIMGKVHYMNWTELQSGSKYNWMSNDELEPIAEKVINTMNNEIKENKNEK